MMRPANARSPNADTLRFPWPRPEEARGLVVRLVAGDPVWVAAVRQQVANWREWRAKKLPFIQCDRFAELTGEAINVVEVTHDSLPAICDWLVALRTRKWTVVALLSRTTITSAADRTAAARLLYEAGAALVLATPREANELSSLLDGQWRLLEARPSDPLDDLPLPSWGPAWQRCGGRIGLSS